MGLTTSIRKRIKKIKGRTEEEKRTLAEKRQKNIQEKQNKKLEKGKKKGNKNKGILNRFYQYGVNELNRTSGRILKEGQHTLNVGWRKINEMAKDVPQVIGGKIREGIKNYGQSQRNQIRNISANKLITGQINTRNWLKDFLWPSLNKNDKNVVSLEPEESSAPTPNVQSPIPLPQQTYYPRPAPNKPPIQYDYDYPAISMPTGYQPRRHPAIHAGVPSSIKYIPM